jgi:hypothetical protein
MKSFSYYSEDRDYELYVEAIHLHEDDTLNEFVSAITGKLKKYYDFIKDLAEKAKIGVKDIAELLKNKGVFEFFKKIGFSIKRLFDLVRNGFKYYRDLQRAIAEYIAETKVVKWTAEKIKDLDEFLKRHPKTKRLVGIAVGAILLYIWLNMSFTGDFDYDFDQSTLISALMGNFSLTDIFTGPEGIKLLTLFITGSFLSFPWPGPQTALFIVSLIYGLSKTFNVRKLLADLRGGAKRFVT